MQSPSVASRHQETCSNPSCCSPASAPAWAAQSLMTFASHVPAAGYMLVPAYLKRGALPEQVVRVCAPSRPDDKDTWTDGLKRRSIKMRQRVLGTLTIGQAPRPDVVPIIDRYVSAEVRRIHRGVLDGLSHAEIAARYRPVGGEPELVTRLQDGTEITLSRARMKDGVQQALAALEAEGCDAILLLCTGTFDGLACDKAWL